LTAKVDKKKIAIILAAAILVIALIVMLAKGGDSTPTASTGVSNNDARVAFLKSFGWDVTTSPAESGQVRIPEQSSEVFDRYNDLQKSQGYDLSQYAGKQVMRYVYKVNNYPGATQDVYATVLVYKDRIIGGDVTDTAPKGQIRGFRMPGEEAPSTQTTAPAS
jgi:hypothetical protein